LAGSAVASLVIARGHRIDAIAEVPLVVADNEIDSITKTKEAIALLKSVGAGADLERVKDSHGLRAGKGKARNRRYVQRRGPLLIHNKERGNEALVKAFRNIQGLDLCNVNRLNLLQLAPGGHVGRFIIWTESAFKQLDSVFGTYSKDSEQKKGFRPPFAVVTNADIGKIISSPEVKKALRPAIHQRHRSRVPLGNPLTNFRSMVKLNPYAKTKKLAAKKQQEEYAKTKQVRTKDAAKKGAEKRKARVKLNRAFTEELLTPAIAPTRGPEEYPPF